MEEIHFDSCGTSVLSKDKTTIYYTEESFFDYMVFSLDLVTLDRKLCFRRKNIASIACGFLPNQISYSTRKRNIYHYDLEKKRKTNVKIETGQHRGFLNFAHVLFEKEKQMILSWDSFSIKAWDPPTGTLLHQISIESENDEIIDLCHITNTNILIFSLSNGEIVKLDMITKEFSLLFRDENDIYPKIVSIPNSDYCIIGSQKGSLSKWNWKECVEVGVFHGSHDGEIRDILLVTENQLCYTTGKDKKILQWNFETFSCLKCIENAHHDWVTNLYTVPGESHIVSIGNDDLLKKWHLDSVLNTKLSTLSMKDIYESISEQYSNIAALYKNNAKDTKDTKKRKQIYLQNVDELEKEEENRRKKTKTLDNYMCLICKMKTSTCISTSCGHPICCQDCLVHAKVTLEKSTDCSLCKKKIDTIILVRL